MRYIKLLHLQTILSAILFIGIVSVLVASSHIESQTLSNEQIETDSIQTKASIVAEIQQVISDYDSTISFELKNTLTVGAAMAVVYKNQIVYQKCYGLRQTGTKDSINENTIFRLASVSKTISGVLAGMLISDSTLSLDRKVIEYLPQLKFKSEPQKQLLTLRNVLSHTSGMPPHTFDDLVEKKIPQDEILQKLSVVGAVSKPGELYAYQNVMYSIFDTIVAAKTGTNYGSVLHEKIFAPFKMKDASVGFEAFANNSNKAMPYSWSKNSYRITPLNDRYYNTLAAAGINASIFDMSQFALHMLSDSDSLVNRARDIIFEPQIPTRLSSGYFTNWENMGTKYYGLGWRIVDYKGRRVAYHGGFLKGYRAEIAICKDENVAIVYLSNSPSMAAARSVPLFLNRFFEFKDIQKLKEEQNETAIP